MKNTSKALFLGFALLGFALSSQAGISVNGLTYNASNPALGAVWVDTVGSMTFDGSGNPVVSSGTLAGNTYKVDFLFGATSGNLDHSSQVFTLAAGLPFNGFLNSGVINVASATLGGGNAGFYQMRAWTGGATFDDVANTRKGTSAITAITFGGTPLAGGAAIASPDLNLHASFAVVPEPATIALGLFGAAGLLMRRRK
jgi:hypothetical protein